MDYNRRKYAHAPDWIDVQERQQDMYDDFGLVCRVELKVDAVQSQCIVRCYHPGKVNRQDCVCQARYSQPLKSTKNIAVGVHNALYDCYLQMERNTATGDAIPPYGVAALP